MHSRFLYGPRFLVHVRLRMRRRGRGRRQHPIPPDDKDPAESTASICSPTTREEFITKHSTCKCLSTTPHEAFRNNEIHKELRCRSARKYRMYCHPYAHTDLIHTNRLGLRCTCNPRRIAGEWPMPSIHNYTEPSMASREVVVEPYCYMPVRCESNLPVRCMDASHVNVCRLPHMKPFETTKSIKNFGASPPTNCLLYTSPSPRDRTRSRMPSSA